MLISTIVSYNKKQMKQDMKNVGLMRSLFGAHIIGDAVANDTGNSEYDSCVDYRIDYNDLNSGIGVYRTNDKPLKELEITSMVTSLILSGDIGKVHIKKSTHNVYECMDFGGVRSAHIEEVIVDEGVNIDSIFFINAPFLRGYITIDVVDLRYLKYAKMCLFECNGHIRDMIISDSLYIDSDSPIFRYILEKEDILSDKRFIGKHSIVCRKVDSVSGIANMEAIDVNESSTMIDILLESNLWKSFCAASVKRFEQMTSINVEVVRKA